MSAELCFFKNLAVNYFTLKSLRSVDKFSKERFTQILLDPASSSFFNSNTKLIYSLKIEVGNSSLVSSASQAGHSQPNEFPLFHLNLKQRRRKNEHTK